MLLGRLVQKGRDGRNMGSILGEHGIDGSIIIKWIFEK
jgi:hypothetical protein